MSQKLFEVLAHQTNEKSWFCSVLGLGTVCKTRALKAAFHSIDDEADAKDLENMDD